VRNLALVIPKGKPFNYNYSHKLPDMSLSYMVTISCVSTGEIFSTFLYQLKL